MHSTTESPAPASSARTVRPMLKLEWTTSRRITQRSWRLLLSSLIQLQGESNKTSFSILQLNFATIANQARRVARKAPGAGAWWSTFVREYVTKKGGKRRIWAYL